VKQPKGEIDIAAAGEWNCVEQSRDGTPEASDIDWVLLMQDKTGTIQYADSSSDDFRWACQGSTMNFVGLARFDHLGYSVEPGILTWTLDQDTTVIRYRFTKVEG